MNPSTLAGVPDAAPPSASWTAVAAIGIGAFALVTTEFLPVGLLPHIARELAVTPGQAGLMVTIPGIVAAVMAPLTLAFAGQLDRRKVLWVLIALLALSNLTVALAHSFAVALLGRVMLGIAVGGFWTIGGSLGPRLRPGAEGARATGLIFSGISLGTVAGVPIGTLIGDLVGWRLAFGAASAVSLLVAAVLMLVLPPIPAGQAQGLRGVAQALKVHRVKLGLAAILLIFIGQFSAYTYIAPFLLDEAGIAAGAISAILFGYGAAGFAGNLVGAWAAARHVRAALAGTAALLAVSIGLLVLAQSHHAAAIAMVLAWGLGFGMLPIVIQNWMFAAAPDRLESVSAIFVSSGQLAVGCGALVGGVTVDQLGLPAAMWLGALCALATAALIGLRGRAPAAA